MPTKVRPTVEQLQEGLHPGWEEELVKLLEDGMTREQAINWLKDSMRFDQVDLALMEAIDRIVTRVEIGEEDREETELETVDLVDPDLGEEDVEGDEPSLSDDRIIPIEAVSMKPCPTCHGTGHDEEGNPCEDCDGWKKLETPRLS